MWKIKFNPDDWESSTCTCPLFQKQYYCKHFIGVALKPKVLIPTATTQIKAKPARGSPKERWGWVTTDIATQPFPNTKRCRGRPKKVGPVLTHDSSPRPIKIPTKRGRGRPRGTTKPKPLQPLHVPICEPNTVLPKRGPGRPRKRPLTLEPHATTVFQQQPTKRTRQ